MIQDLIGLMIACVIMPFIIVAMVFIIVAGFTAELAKAIIGKVLRQKMEISY